MTRLRKRFRHTSTVFLPIGKKGDFDKAMAGYTEAIRLRPDFADAYNNRGNAYCAKGGSNKAIADYTEAIRLGELRRLVCPSIGMSVATAVKGALDAGILLAKKKPTGLKTCIVAGIRQSRLRARESRAEVIRRNTQSSIIAPTSAQATATLGTPIAAGTNHGDSSIAIVLRGAMDTGRLRILRGTNHECDSWPSA